MSPIRKIAVKWARDRERVVTILKTLSEGHGDAYMCYRELHSVWVSNNAAVTELKPLFRMNGVDPDGALSVTDSFKAEVRSLATQILRLMEADPPVKQMRSKSSPTGGPLEWS